MHFRLMVGIAAVALSAGVAGCNRAAQETRDEAKDTAAGVADGTDEARRHRDADVSRLVERVAEIERDYAAKSGQLAAGARTATGALVEEVREDVANVKDAVNSLASTTAENWWDREEAAIRRAVDDVGEDVKRLARNVPDPAPVATDTPSTAPFTSRRDAFVTEMKGRVNTFRRALDDVKASGPNETEVKDTVARVDKLAEDLDALARASSDDWWDVTKTRVEAYVDRVEASVQRLDDDRPRSE